jgi:hypothetical protein
MGAFGKRPSLFLYDSLASSVNLSATGSEIFISLVCLEILEV